MPLCECVYACMCVVLEWSLKMTFFAIEILSYYYYYWNFYATHGLLGWCFKRGCVTSVHLFQVSYCCISWHRLSQVLSQSKFRSLFPFIAMSSCILCGFFLVWDFVVVVFKVVISVRLSGLIMSSSPVFVRGCAKSLVRWLSVHRKAVSC